MKRKNKMRTTDSMVDKSNDSWGVWADRIVRKREQFLMRLCSFYVKMNCIYWKINIGKGCRFWGKIYFRRRPGSTITIGNNNTFRSASWSNLVGINHPCMICTLTPNAKIIIGNDSGLSGTVVSAAEFIEIGSNVLCGANVTITDTDWHPPDRHIA